MLCDGDELALRFVTDRLVVGERLGEVPASVPTVPLEADLAATTRRLRLKREPTARALDLDLRRGIDRERSQLFHRLRLLELGWAVPATSDVQATGTFRETWRLRWQPELAIAVVEAAVWGTTVESAATARVESVVAGQSLVELARTVERCLLAALPDALERLLGGLRRPGGARRRRRAPDGGAARARPGRALRRRPRHRHRRPAADRRGPGPADLRRAGAGDDRAGRRQRRPGARPGRRGARRRRAAGAGRRRRGAATSGWPRSRPWPTGPTWPRCCRGG